MSRASNMPNTARKNPDWVAALLLKTEDRVDDLSAALESVLDNLPHCACELMECPKCYGHHILEGGTSNA